MSKSVAQVNRRAILLTGGSLAVGTVLSACVVEQAAPPGSVQTPADQSSPPAGSQQSPEPVAEKPLVRVDEIEARGGVVLKDEKLVVTRDAEGTPHAFSAVCTHRGCLVATVGDGTVDCPCHGSKFDVATGKPVAGPAKAPLAPVSIELRNGGIFRA